MIDVEAIRAQLTTFTLWARMPVGDVIAMLDEIVALRAQAAALESVSFVPPFPMGTKVRLTRKWGCNYTQSDMSLLRVEYPVGAVGTVLWGRLNFYDTWKSEYMYRIQFDDRSDEIDDEYLELAEHITTNAPDGAGGGT